MVLIEIYGLEFFIAGNVVSTVTQCLILINFCLVLHKTRKSGSIAGRFIVTSAEQTKAESAELADIFQKSLSQKR